MPSRSRAESRFLNARFGHAWVVAHGFDNPTGRLPEHVQDGRKKGGAVATHRRRHKKKGRRFIQDAIQRPGALTAATGGKPSKNVKRVRALAAAGTPLQKKQAQFYLNVLRPASKAKR